MACMTKDSSRHARLMQLSDSGDSLWSADVAAGEFTSLWKLPAGGFVAAGWKRTGAGADALLTRGANQKILSVARLWRQRDGCVHRRSGDLGWRIHRLRAQQIVQSRQMVGPFRGENRLGRRHALDKSLRVARQSGLVSGGADAG